MRGTKAKQLRRQARSMALAAKPKTIWYKFLNKAASLKEGKAVYDYRGTLAHTGYRRAYQDLKRVGVQRAR